MVWGMCGVFCFAFNCIPVLTIINFCVLEKKIINKCFGINIKVL